MEKEDAVTYPCDAPDQPGNAIIFTDGFPTANGRAKMVPAKLTQPAELPDDEYPLILTTGRMLEHWHTGAMTRRSQTLDQLEPEAVVSMNSYQMGQYDLGPGDTVQVSTRRGSIDIKVRADQDVPAQYGLFALRICGGGGQSADQFRSRPLWQNPRVQILCS